MSMPADGATAARETSSPLSRKTASWTSLGHGTVRVVPPKPGTPAFLNPRVEDPLDFLDLDLDDTFMVLARDDLSDIDRDRTDFTIETLKLNRDVLLKARATAFGSYRARLHEYVNLREVTTTEEIDRLVESLKTMPHATVWAEMKRQHSFVPNLDALFSRAPEALDW